MGDSYQIIVDIDATGHEVEILASHVHGYLTSNRIISGIKNSTWCTEGAKTYLPGSNCDQAMVEPYPLLHNLAHNELEIITKRSVFFPTSSDEPEMICAACGNKFTPRSEWPSIIDEWWNQTGPALISCRNCGRQFPLPEWKMEPPWAQWGFGYLGFKFWNWAPLRDDFVTQVGERLNHRVHYIYGKL